MNKTLGDQWHLMPTMGGEPRGDKIPTKSGREGIRKNPNGRDLLRIRELFKSGSWFLSRSGSPIPTPKVGKFSIKIGEDFTWCLKPKTIKKSRRNPDSPQFSILILRMRHYPRSRHFVEVGELMESRSLFLWGPLLAYLILLTHVWVPKPKWFIQACSLATTRPRDEFVLALPTETPASYWCWNDCC